MFFILIYVVKQGDSLYSIGNTYGMDYKRIALENEIPLEQTLVIGQTLVLTDVDVTDKLGTIEVNGYAFPNIKDDVLSKTLPHLTYLSIFSYSVRADGTLSQVDDEHLINMCKIFRTMPIMVINNIESTGGFDSQLVSDILYSTAVSDLLINNIITTMKQKGYMGLNVDFEYVLPSDRDAYNDFLSKVSTAMHNEGFLLTVAAAPKTSTEQKGTLYEAHDYNFFGTVADRVVLMTYEWGYTYSPPMPVAPLPQVEKVVDYALTEIPSEKILMGIPNYGYNWTLPFTQGSRASVVSNYDAVDIARRNKAQISFDNVAMSPFIEYYEPNGTKHIVWFEDARSINSKLILIYNKELSGPSYWTINRYFPQNWLVLESLFNVQKNLA